jgi:preprotein translocase subunit YajC
MRPLLASFASVSLMAFPALAAPPFAVGTAVVDPRGNPVGTIAATEGDLIAIVRTDRHAISIPFSSFSSDPAGGAVVALSQAELNAKVEANRAAIAASLEVGKPVKGPDGRLLGTIAAISDEGVEVRLAPGRSVMFPRDSIVGGVDCAVASISLEELEARLGIPPVR